MTKNKMNFTAKPISTTTKDRCWWVKSSPKPLRVQSVLFSIRPPTVLRVMVNRHTSCLTPPWVDAIGLRREEVSVRRMRVGSSSLSSGIDLAVMLWQGCTLTYGSLCYQPDSWAHTVNNDENDFSLFLSLPHLLSRSLCCALPRCGHPAFVNLVTWVSGPGKYSNRLSLDEIPLLKSNIQSK